MKLIRKRGSTSNILRVFLRDSSSTTGAGKTGLGIASAGLNISLAADNEATATTYTAAGSTIETITTLGTFAAPTATKCRFKEFDATNLPGVYEIQFADARYSVSSSKSIQGMITATGVVPCPFEIDLEPGTVDDTLTTNLATANTNINTIDDFVDTEISTLITNLATANTNINTIDDFVDTEITTILNRLGSITGSGANTILGILQAICRNNATLPSDIGGTYAVATHSLQALASVLGITGQGDNLAEVIDNIYGDLQSVVIQLTTIDDFVDTEISTILSRLGSITGTGTNTVLGYFQSLMRNDVTISSDIGGTYDDALHSLQAIKTALNTVDDFVDTEISTLITNLGSSQTFDTIAEAADAAADNSNSNANEIAKIIAEIVDTSYNAFTAHQLLRIAAAGAAGKTAGGGTGEETFYDVGLGTIRIIVSTITGANRASVVYPFTV